jgi:hypothetical protein
MISRGEKQGHARSLRSNENRVARQIQNAHARSRHGHPPRPLPVALSGKTPGGGLARDRRTGEGSAGAQKVAQGGKRQTVDSRGLRRGRIVGGGGRRGGVDPAIKRVGWGNTRSTRRIGPRDPSPRARRRVKRRESPEGGRRRLEERHSGLQRR